MTTLSPCLCCCLCVGRGALVQAQMWCCGTEVELDVQGQIQVSLMAQTLLCRAVEENSTEKRGQEQGEERQLTFSPLPLGSRSICWIWQFRGRKESCVEFSLPSYSSNTMKTLESVFRGYSVMSEVHLEGAPAHSSVTLYTWVTYSWNEWDLVGWNSLWTSFNSKTGTEASLGLNFRTFFGIVR